MAYIYSNNFFALDCCFCVQQCTTTVRQDEKICVSALVSHCDSHNLNDASTWIAWKQIFLFQSAYFYFQYQFKMQRLKKDCLQWKSAIGGWILYACIVWEELTSSGILKLMTD